MNKLMAHHTAHAGTEIGILDTPCYPARYYAGYIRRVMCNEWVPADNSTHLFYRTLGDAKAAYAKVKGWTHANHL